MGPSSEEDAAALVEEPACQPPVAFQCTREPMAGAPWAFGGRGAEDVKTAVMSLLYFSDFCVFLRPTRYLYRGAHLD